jgi:hypothetical protein
LGDCKISFLRILILGPARPGEARNILLNIRLAVLRRSAFIEVEVTSHYPGTYTSAVCSRLHNSTAPEFSRLLTHAQEYIPFPLWSAKFRWYVCIKASEEVLLSHVLQNQMLHLEFFFITQPRQEVACVLAPDAAIKQGSVWRIGCHVNVRESRLRKDP